MGNADNSFCGFPSTSLQIGDLKSYLSRLSLFLALDSKKVYIMVDNRPWLEDLVSQFAHLWQLMITKVAENVYINHFFFISFVFSLKIYLQSTLSPFANIRERKVRKENTLIGELYELGDVKASPSEKNILKRWFSLVDALVLSHKRALHPVKKLRISLFLNNKLHRIIDGFIVFEVALGDVHGMNYANELQTDTFLAIEAKSMKTLEFDSIILAARHISSWFPGTNSGLNLLKGHLDSEIGEIFYYACENFPTSSGTDDDENITNTCVEDESPCYHPSNFSVSPIGVENMVSIPNNPLYHDVPKKKTKIAKSPNNGIDINLYFDEAAGSLICSRSSSDSEEVVEPVQYSDVLPLFRMTVTSLSN